MAGKNRIHVALSIARADEAVVLSIGCQVMASVAYCHWPSAVVAVLAIMAMPSRVLSASGSENCGLSRLPTLYGVGELSSSSIEGKVTDPISGASFSRLTSMKRLCTTESLVPSETNIETTRLLVSG